MTCDLCEDTAYRLRSLGKGVWACSDCSGPSPVSERKKSLMEKVKVGRFTVSRAQLDEMERRVILPYDKPGGGYYLGRRMENGKVNENRVPDYGF